MRMRRLSVSRVYAILTCSVLCVPAALLAQQRQPSAPAPGPASLDLDTCGCPTTFGEPGCELQTHWSLEKTTDSGDFENPNGDDFSFDVTVTEGPTNTILSGTGQIFLSNSGDQTPTLSSIALMFELSAPGEGDAPGPSGQNWMILEAVTQTEHAMCEGEAVTCDGSVFPSAGASLQLFECDSMEAIQLSDHVEIPPSIDNDDDGQVDEDPAHTGANDDACEIIDNDGDGMFDEDPVDGLDNDLDGEIDEDDPDDDGDGLVDEDGACDDAVVICFAYEFDVTDQDLVSGDLVRLDMQVTFKTGGRRGGTCDADVDCDGMLENGKMSNPDEGEGTVRTIQQRLQFDWADCTPVCDTVTLTDNGAEAVDPDCVDVTTDAINAAIDAAGEGTETHATVEGTVTCFDGICSTTVTNTASLTCENEDLIEGSMATASFDAGCTFECPIDGDPQHCQTPDQQGHDGTVGATSDATSGFAVRENFIAPEGGQITSVCWWGFYVDFNTDVPMGSPEACTPQSGDNSADSFTVTYYADAGGVPDLGTVIGGPFNVGEANETATGRQIPSSVGDLDELFYTANHEPVSVSPGECVWVQIQNTTDGQCRWLWETAPPGDEVSYQQTVSGYDLGLCVNLEIEPDGCGCVESEPNETSCNDSLDNDCDGLFDCNDPDCNCEVSNDSCASAIDITANINGAPVLGDNNGATPPGNDPELPAGSPTCNWSGVPGNTHNTVWYTFVAPPGGITIETCALGGGPNEIVDSIIALYSGTCGSLVQVGCGEDECGGFSYLSRISTALTPGETYYLMVGNPGGWAGSIPGMFQVDITSP